MSDTVEGAPETAAPATPFVGDRVRLANGVELTVYGIRETEGALSLMSFDGPWVDAAGCSIIPAE